MQLNAEQQQVIDVTNHCLVIAGPGSGKTRTVVSKIGQVLKGSDLTRVVAVTFTRDSATEMGVRLRREFGEATSKRALIGTFHALAYRQLKAAKLIDRVLAPHEQSAYIEQTLHAMKVKPDLREMVVREIETCKCSLDFDMYAIQEDHPILNHYQMLIRRVGALDMHDLLREAVRHMRRGTLAPIDCSHLMVDEFQDTDECQYAWIQEHINHGSMVTAIGDDDQSIYAWRRAMGYAGMQRFLDDTRGTRIELSSNYRSFAEITDVGDNIVSLNRDRMPKRIFAARGTGGAVKLATFVNSTSEMEAIVNAIIRWCKAYGHVDPNGRDATGSPMERFVPPAGTWAVLARTGFQLRPLHAWMIGMGVVARRSGRNMWALQPISTFLSFLTFLETHDAVGFDLMCRFSHISNGALHQLHTTYDSHFDDLFISPPKLDGIQKEDHARLTLLCQRMLGWHHELRIKRYKVLIDGLVDYMCDVISGSNKTKAADETDTSRGEDPRITDLKLAGTILQRMSGSLQVRIARVTSSDTTSSKKKKSKDSDKEAPSPSEGDGAPGVALHTIHGAKGLEFDHVWVTGLDRDVFPSAKSPEDEERRLFYVAITRAKNELYLSGTSSKGVSRFHDEVRDILRR